MYQLCNYNKEVKQEIAGGFYFFQLHAANADFIHFIFPFDIVFL